MESRGEIEIYGFHALESLQCMVERRLKDGQQGVKMVTCLEWRRGLEGRRRRRVVVGLVGGGEGPQSVAQRRRHSGQLPSVRAAAESGRRFLRAGPVASVVEYRDGLKATALILNGHTDDTTFAARLADKKAARLDAVRPTGTAGAAAFLEALAVSKGRGVFHDAQAAISGGAYIADRAAFSTEVLESRLQKGKRLETPDLDLEYASPKDSGFLRREL